MHFRRVVAAGRIAKMLQVDQQRSNENGCCYRPEQPAISSNEANSHKSNSVDNQKGDIANAPKALLPCCSNPALASVCCDSRSAGSSPARHDRLQVDAACTHWLCAGCRGVRVDGYLLPWPRTRNARSRTNSNAGVRSGLAAKTFGNPGVEGGAQTARPIAPHRLRIAHLLFWGGWLRQLLAGRLFLLHAPQGSLNTVNDACRKNIRPLIDRLVAHADRFSSSRNRAAQLLNCFSFIHPRIES